jgi:hypothetical protein
MVCGVWWCGVVRVGYTYTRRPSLVPLTESTRAVRGNLWLSLILIPVCGPWLLCSLLSAFNHRSANEMKE